jgi:hypothetical protein
MKNVEIDLNVRTKNNWTYVDAGDLREHELVNVFESETNLGAVGMVTEIDHELGIAYIWVDWASFVWRNHNEPYQPDSSA